MTKVKKTGAIFLAAALLIGSIDYCYVAPFLVQLIDF